MANACCDRFSNARSEAKLFFFINCIFVFFSVSIVYCIINDFDNFGLQQQAVKDGEPAVVKFNDRNIEMPEKYPMVGVIGLTGGVFTNCICITVYLFGLFYPKFKYYVQYNRLLFVDFMCTVSATLLLFISEPKAADRIQDLFRAVMLIKYGEDNHILDRYIDRTQTINECCGYRNHTDWLQSKWAVNHPNRYPESCCESTESGKQCVFGKFLYAEPCKDHIFAYYGQFRIIMKYLSLVKSIITFVGLYYCARLHQASRRPGILERTIPLFHAPELRLGVGLGNSNQQQRNSINATKSPQKIISPTPSENVRRSSYTFSFNDMPQMTLKV